MDIYKKWFGQRLQYLREREGYRTQESFADDMEVKSASVSRWETGESFPSKTKFEKICRLLKAKPETFLQFSPEPEPKATGASLSDAWKVLSAYEMAEPHIRRGVLNVLGLEPGKPLAQLLDDAHNRIRAELQAHKLKKQ